MTTLNIVLVLMHIGSYSTAIETVPESFTDMTMCISQGEQWVDLMESIDDSDYVFNCVIIQ